MEDRSLGSTFLLFTRRVSGEEWSGRGTVCNDN